MIITEDRAILFSNASSFENKMRDIVDWNNYVDKKIYEYDLTLPNHICVSGDVGSGRTTLRYEGYLTDSSGGRVEFTEEKSFDFVPDPVLFD